MEKDFDLNKWFSQSKVSFGKWKYLRKSLKSFLESGERKIDKWFDLCSVNSIDFSKNEEMFVNINNKEEFNKYKNKVQNVLE